MNKTCACGFALVKIPAVAKAAGSSWVPSVLMGTRPYESFTFCGDSVFIFVNRQRLIAMPVLNG